MTLDKCASLVHHLIRYSMNKTELVIQLLKIAIGIAFQLLFVVELGRP
jgi:hypothetical protein